MRRLNVGVVIGVVASWFTFAYADGDDLLAPPTPSGSEDNLLAPPAPSTAPNNRPPPAAPSPSPAPSVSDENLLAPPPPSPSDNRVASSSNELGPAPLPIEIGFYSGGFISNYYHQFYDFDVFPGQVDTPQPGVPIREELKRVSLLNGLRFAYFVEPWLGFEGEFTWIMTNTKYTDKSANIYGGRVQAIFQLATLSKYVVPYATIGDGFDRIISPVETLGSDTDWAPHVGVGARFLIHRSITFRADGRFLRGPSMQPPFHLNASLAEFMFGLSYRPSRKPPEPPPPPPPPDPDSDGDGLRDSVDKCPREAEDQDVFDDSDGCPDPDNDGDGIVDANDKCALESEDKDGFEDDDGCNDKDNDADGVVDAQDKCGTEAEDRDGFKDLDGCPEPDNDNDSFLDGQDKCPNEAEVINGVDDDDGCADRGDALVVVSPDRLELLEGIQFTKTIIQKASFNVLGQVAATMRAHPEILRLRITVHVQPTKNPAADQRLSELRAFAIREWMIKFGIDEKRLEPRGFGGTKPLVNAKEKGSRDINERIDLIILERK